MNFKARLGRVIVITLAMVIVQIQADDESPSRARWSVATGEGTSSPLAPEEVQWTYAAADFDADSYAVVGWRSGYTTAPTQPSRVVMVRNDGSIMLNVTIPTLIQTGSSQLMSGQRGGPQYLTCSADAVTGAPKRIVFMPHDDGYNEIHKYTKGVVLVDLPDRGSGAAATAQASQWPGAQRFVGAIVDMTEVDGTILYAGGFNNYVFHMSQSCQYCPETMNTFATVDVYHCATNSWTSKQLSVARANIAGVRVGNKALFMGGRLNTYDSHGNFANSGAMDIYDATSGVWSSSSLPSSYPTGLREILPIGIAADPYAILVFQTRSTSSLDLSVEVLDTRAMSWVQPSYAVPPISSDVSCYGSFKASPTRSIAVFVRYASSSAREVEVNVFDSSIVPVTNAWTREVLAKETGNACVVVGPELVIYRFDGASAQVHTKIFSLLTRTWTNGTDTFPDGWPAGPTSAMLDRPRYTITSTFHDQQWFRATYFGAPLKTGGQSQGQGGGAGATTGSGARRGAGAGGGTGSDQNNESFGASVSHAPAAFVTFGSITGALLLLFRRGH